MTIWRLNNEFAESDDIPGVRIPNASFPGVVSVLPGPAQLIEMLRRERTWQMPVVKFLCHSQREPHQSIFVDLAGLLPLNA